MKAEDELQIQSFDDVRKLGDDGKILVMGGSESQFWLQRLGGLQIDGGGADQATNLRKLLAGRGRFFYRHEIGMRAEIYCRGLEQKIKILPASLHTENQYLVVSRTAQPKMVERLRNAVKKLQANGELTKILAKYLNNRPEHCD